MKSRREAPRASPYPRRCGLRSLRPADSTGGSLGSRPQRFRSFVLPRSRAARRNCGAANRLRGVRRPMPSPPIDETYEDRRPRESISGRPFGLAMPTRWSKRWFPGSNGSKRGRQADGPQDRVAAFRAICEPGLAAGCLRIADGPAQGVEKGVPRLERSFRRLREGSSEANSAPGIGYRSHSRRTFRGRTPSPISLPPWGSRICGTDRPCAVGFVARNSSRSGALWGVWVAARS
jgi:hypothetical protein